MAENPTPIGAMKTAVLAELARVLRENRFSPAFLDDATGGIYEHNLAARLGLIITGRGSDEDAIRADTFWRALDSLQREGVLTRHVRMAGFEFKSIRLTEAGLRQALRSGFLQPGWDEPEDELLTLPPSELTPRTASTFIRAFEPRGDDLPLTRARLLSPRPPVVVNALRNLLWATEERDLGEGHSPIAGAPDWLFPQANIALDLVRLSPEPTRQSERAAAAWDTAIATRLRDMPARGMLVVAGLPADPGWRARRRIASAVAGSLDVMGRMEPRLGRPGLPETRRVTLERQGEVPRCDYYYPAVPGSATVLSFIDNPISDEGVRSGLQRLGRKSEGTAAARSSVPAGWRFALGLWVADAATLADDSLALWWTALTGSAQLREAVRVYDEVYLLWAPAGFSPVRLGASANLMQLG